MAVHVIRAGLLTTIQDYGRWGYQSRGVSVSGPMDPFSHQAANAIVGNQPDAGLLEVTIVGPHLVFDDSRDVVVCGARFDIAVDGLGVPTNQVFRIEAGQTLTFGERREGTRAYVAIAGGIETPLVLGSRSTHVVSHLGGFEGRALKAGDLLPLGAPKGAPPSATRVEGQSLRSTPGGVRVRVLAGPHADWFSRESHDLLQSSPYRVSANSDRIGFRLEGQRISSREGRFVSDATTFGAIQVPPSGQPIVLMADRQTTGGYPTIATVISADLPLVGQLGPGDHLSFVECTREEAVAALAVQQQTLQELTA
jgi:antagonist of KipI